jgi:DNA-directed RNA polymerase specialized sigma24 family protein
MQDRALVAAIVAGDPEGLAEAYDRYAAPLYTYCRFMLPDPHPPAEVAGAVADTLLIAASRLTELRDPDQLRCWLYAVARNECLRQLSPAELASGAAARADRAKRAERAGPQPAPDGAMPELMPPAGLREQVLEALADDTPTGRAYRASIAHRAGPFDRTGFPKPVISPRFRRWQEVQLHPRVATAVAALAAAVVAAGITALVLGTGGHRAHASTLSLRGPGSSSGPASVPPGARSSPGGKPSPDPDSPARSPNGPKTTPGKSPGTVRSPRPARSSSPSRSPSGSPSASRSPSPSPSSSPPPAPGTLAATPAKLVLTAVKGTAASGTFLLTADGGPVDDFTIHSPRAKVTVSPSAGSLPSAGSWVSVTVTVKSLVSLDTRLTVDPGGLVITVVLTVKA